MVIENIDHVLLHGLEILDVINHIPLHSDVYYIIEILERTNPTNILYVTT